MAQIKKIKTSRKIEEQVFGKRNWMILGSGVGAIIIGFIALASGSITLAPILLVLGYCVLIPIGIMIRDKNEESKVEGG
jgi:uncharacterized membrane protein HdeD (DUF308 family)